MKQQAVYLSPCHGEPISGERGGGVWVGRCPVCGEDLTRMNRQTGVLEWLDGHAPTTPGDLRIVTAAPVLIDVSEEAP